MVDLDSLPCVGTALLGSTWADTRGEPITLPQNPCCVTCVASAGCETQGPAEPMKEGWGQGAGAARPRRLGQCQALPGAGGPLPLSYGCNKPRPVAPRTPRQLQVRPARQAGPPGQVETHPAAAPPASVWLSSPGAEGPQGPPTLSSSHRWWESAAVPAAWPAPHHSCRRDPRLSPRKPACRRLHPLCSGWAPRLPRWEPRTGHSRCPCLPPTPRRHPPAPAKL